MYKEITFYGNNVSENEIINTIFKSLEFGVCGLNVSSNYLTKISSILPEGITLSTPIDYPYGLSDNKVRQHQTISAIRRGATDIDLVISPTYILNNKKNNLIQDIQTHQEICKDKKVNLRIMLEYRHFDNQTLFELVRVCKNLKIEYLFPSTGHFADDFMDNLIVGKLIKSQYPTVKVITNGNIWKKTHYDTIESSEIYGMRLKSQNLL